MVTEWLREVRVLDPLSGTDQVSDVWVVDGVLAAIRTASSQDMPPSPTQLVLDESLKAVLPADITEQEIETTHQPGLVLAPGLVDLYSHSGEPGYESRETLKSLVAGAIAGGVTRLTLLPDTYPALDTPASVEHIRRQLQSLTTVDALNATPQVNVWGALTLGTKGDQLAELGDLAQADVAGFSDGVPLQNSMLLRRSLEYSQMFAQPIALWPCDRPLAGKGVARECATSVRLGLVGNPALSETTALAALLEVIADTYGSHLANSDANGSVPSSPRVHIMRVSTARSVELIRAAKSRGLPITASTTWMHLLWSVEDLDRYDPTLHLDPPLGTDDDRAALIDGVKSGVIDAIAIDHSPYTYEEKTVAFAQSPSGAIGLELALSALWERFVASGEWTALDLWAALSLNPALCLNQSPPSLLVGQPAEMVLFDPQATWQVTPHTLESQSSNTPLLGQSLNGKVLKVWT
ncbi:MAG: dihydroorotase [Leptolyngbyaceae bacterium]|nr:dihydroorotase [Leptolyngbyaceae bacterium]